MYKLTPENVMTVKDGDHVWVPDPARCGFPVSLIVNERNEDLFFTSLRCPAGRWFAEHGNFDVPDDSEVDYNVEGRSLEEAYYHMYEHLRVRNEDNDAWYAVASRKGFANALATCAYILE